MVYENEHFIIKYTEADLDYIEEAIDRLNEKYIEYMDFFQCSELPKKVELILYDDLEEFRNVLIKRNGSVKESTVGFASGNTIEIVTLSERKKVESQKNSTKDTLIMTFAHELLHIFHIFYMGSGKNSWFAEGLAICLGSPRYELGDIDCSVDDLKNKKFKSRHAYAMVKYMLENLPHEKVLEYAKNPDLVVQDTETIKIQADEWINSLNKGKSI